MDYILKKAAKSVIITSTLILALWSILYTLTNFKTVISYVGIGFTVCIVNSVLLYLSQKQNVKKILQVRSSWLVMAGVVLVLYHAGFTLAAVFVAAAILVSPLFWSSLAEGIVGFSLLITLFIRMCYLN